jgi:hypothetical protein
VDLQATGDFEVVGVFFDAEPLALELLGGGGGGAGAEEGIENEVTFIRGAGDELFDEVDGLLRGVAALFLRVPFKLGTRRMLVANLPASRWARRAFLSL